MSDVATARFYHQIHKYCVELEHKLPVMSWILPWIKGLRRLEDRVRVPIKVKFSIKAASREPTQRPLGRPMFRWSRRVDSCGTANEIWCISYLLVSFHIKIWYVSYFIGHGPLRLCVLFIIRFIRAMTVLTVEGLNVTENRRDYTATRQYSRLKTHFFEGCCPVKA